MVEGSVPLFLKLNYGTYGYGTYGNMNIDNWQGRGIIGKKKKGRIVRSIVIYFISIRLNGQWTIEE